MVAGVDLYCTLRSPKPFWLTYNSCVAIDCDFRSICGEFKRIDRALNPVTITKVADKISTDEDYTGLTAAQFRALDIMSGDEWSRAVLFTDAEWKEYFNSHPDEPDAYLQGVIDRAKEESRELTHQYDFNNTNDEYAELITAITTEGSRKAAAEKAAANYQARKGNVCSIAAKRKQRKALKKARKLAAQGKTSVTPVVTKAKIIPKIPAKPKRPIHAGMSRGKELRGRSE